jgi:hypothetical protein
VSLTPKSQGKIIQIQEVPVPSLLKENPLLCHEADAALKKIM